MPSHVAASQLLFWVWETGNRSLVYPMDTFVLNHTANISLYMIQTNYLILQTLALVSC